MDINNTSMDVVISKVTIKRITRKDNKGRNGIIENSWSKAKKLKSKIEQMRDGTKTKQIEKWKFNPKCIDNYIKCKQTKYSNLKTKIVRIN